MTDLVSRLLEAIEQAERLASFREELPGMDFGITDSKSWHTKGCGYRQSEWMEACDCDVPSSVLRRCAADRRTVEEWLKQVENPFNGLSHEPPYFIVNLFEAYGLEVTQ